MNTSSLLPWSASAFETKYRQNDDPWNFATSLYERKRYQSTLDALSHPAYGPAFEPGCSIGELSRQLAARCQSVFATDISASSVATAKQRCSDLLNVDFRCGEFSIANFPQGPFDLMVLSEILYYFSKQDLVNLAASAHEHLSAGGELIAVHWLGHSVDHQLHGDTVHEILNRCLRLRKLKEVRDEGFRIDSWERM